MSRPQKIRKITKLPTVSGFKPYGSINSSNKQKAIFLLCEEYEALRLNDYEKCNQCEAAAIMQVSRPTFTRIYLSAREKIATAFIEGRKIIIEGGKIEYGNDWLFCENCGCVFSKENGDNPKTCPLCGAENISEYIPNPHEENLTTMRPCGKGRCKNRNHKK
jgi:uncharacterized protein